MPRAEFYVQFKASIVQSTGRVVGITAEGMTKNRPSNPQGDLTVKFVVDIPDEVIYPEINVELNTLGSTIKSLQETAKDLK